MAKRRVKASQRTAESGRDVEASRDADLFVCKCNFFDKEAPGHLDYETLAANRARRQCKRLVITHMSAEMLGHLPESEFEAAHDGAVIEL